MGGAWRTGCRALGCPIAGEGDVARYMSRSAPSSPPPVRGVRDQEIFGTLLLMRICRSGGGVCGGDDVICDELMRVDLFRKLVTGRSASSSSLNSGECGSSAMVDPSEMKERCDT